MKCCFRRLINVLYYHQISVSFFFLLTLESLLLSKQSICDSFRDLIHGANKKESALLEEFWLSEECMQAIMAFMQRKSKL